MRSCFIVATKLESGKAVGDGLARGRTALVGSSHFADAVVCRKASDLSSYIRDLPSGSTIILYPLREGANMETPLETLDGIRDTLIFEIDV